MHHPDVLSDWERATHNGISPDHPELLYRLDLLENSIPIPKGGHPHLPTKTVYGVLDSSLAHQGSSFRHRDADGRDTLGPVVIWIATHLTTTTTRNAHDASLGILALLKANGVEGAVAEWYEGAIEKL